MLHNVKYLEKNFFAFHQIFIVEKDRQKAIGYGYFIWLIFAGEIHRLIARGQLV